MSISVRCQCGKSFSARDELAGKTVRCPGCKSPLKIPAPEPAPSQAIVAECSCGARFSAPPKLAGKRVMCPTCNRPLVVPNPTEAPDPLTNAMAEEWRMPESDLDDLFAAAESAAPMQAPPPTFTPPAPRPTLATPTGATMAAGSEPQSPGISNQTWVIIGVAAVAIIAMLLFMVAGAAAMLVPALAETVRALITLGIIAFLAIAFFGSLICALMVLSELWSDGHEGLVMMCVVVGLVPSAFVCGWVYGANRMVMIIWSILLAPLLVLCLFGICLNAISG